LNLGEIQGLQKPNPSKVISIPKYGNIIHDIQGNNSCSGNVNCIFYSKNLLLKKFIIFYYFRRIAKFSYNQ